MTNYSVLRRLRSTLVNYLVHCAKVSSVLLRHSPRRATVHAFSAARGLLQALVTNITLSLQTRYARKLQAHSTGRRSFVRFQVELRDTRPSVNGTMRSSWINKVSNVDTMKVHGTFPESKQYILSPPFTVLTGAHSRILSARSHGTGSFID